MTKKQTALLSVNALREVYPDALCSLDSSDPYQLLVSVRLSAQCTDARVNLVTPELFRRYPDAEALSRADVEDVARIIRSCGFFRQKASDIVGAAKMITETYGGRVPDTIEELLKLPGVGRKSANLIVGDVYGKPAVVCDTHAIRITNRLGLTSTKDPAKCETELRRVLPPEESNNFCHRLVLHGRAVCAARRPKCGECVMRDFCETARTTIQTGKEH